MLSHEPSVNNGPPLRESCVPHCYCFGRNGKLVSIPHSFEMWELPFFDEKYSNFRNSEIAQALKLSCKQTECNCDSVTAGFFDDV